MKFYTELRDDLDAGKITIDNGQITKTATDDDSGWRYEINDLSPMDKFALVEYLEGNGRHNPFYLSAWELLNSYNRCACGDTAMVSVCSHQPTSLEGTVSTPWGHHI